MLALRFDPSWFPAFAVGLGEPLVGGGVIGDLIASESEESRTFVPKCSGFGELQMSLETEANLSSAAECGVTSAALFNARNN